MGILFTGKENDPKTLENVLGEAIGAASVCWEKMDGTGVFDEQRARAILAEVVGWINTYYVKSSDISETQTKRNMVRWFRNGDHPYDRVGKQETDWIKYERLRPDLFKNTADDVPEAPPEAQYTRIEGAVVRYFRRPEREFAGDKVHDVCSFTWHDHGWIDSGGDGVVVCPGDWIVLDA